MYEPPYNNRLQTSAMSYGNPSINAIIERLSGHLNGIPMDGTAAHNRRYAQLLLGKMKKDYKDRDPLVTALRLIDLTFTPGIKELEFHQRLATKVSYIYYNAGRIIAAWQAGRAKGGDAYSDRAAASVAERIARRREQEAARAGDQQHEDDQGGAVAADAGDGGEVSGQG